MIARLVGARTVEIDSGHLVMLSAPSAIAALLDRPVASA
jgi:hypothetical protein